MPGLYIVAQTARIHVKPIHIDLHTKPRLDRKMHHYTKCANLTLLLISVDTDKE